MGYLSSVDWLLQESPSGEQVLSCDQFYDGCSLSYHVGDYSLSRMRRCIPSNACYRFAIGDGFYRIYDYDLPVAAFNISFEGRLLVSREGFRFESFEFGHGCKESVCDNGEESSLEVFLWRQRPGWEKPDLSLEVRDVDSSQLLLEQTWQISNSAVLHYHHSCLARNFCLNLSISVPETTTMTDLYDNLTVGYSENIALRVSLDDVIFRDSTFPLGGNLFEYTFEKSVELGQCTAADLCDHSIEFLLDLTLDVSVDAPAPYQEFFWWVEYVRDKAKNDLGDHFPDAGRIFEGYFVGRSYRVYQCIPSDECTEFKTYSPYWPPPLIEYALAVNGDLKQQRLVEKKEWYATDDRYIVTRLGGEHCPLSKGGIAAMAIGSVIAFLAILFVGYALCCKKICGSNEAVATRDDTDDKTELSEEDMEEVEIHDVETI
jgi:hypothetical protein